MTKNTLPEFSKIKLEDIEANLTALLAHSRNQVDALLQQTSYSWTNLMQPLEDIEDTLDKWWSPISHMHAVVSSEKLRKVYHDCLPKLSEYYTELGHNTSLFNAIKSISQSDEFATLTQAQKKVIENQLRDFHLSGVDLSPEDKKQFAKLQERLTKLTTQFEENVLDSTQGWTYLVTDKENLKGLPEHAVAVATQTAKTKNVNGWIFSLEAPSYIPVMTYADSRKLRKEMYHAYVTRASDQGPNAGKWDNSETMQAILLARLELAKLLGFKNYAELSLATKMAKKTDQVLTFLNQLVDASLAKAKADFAELTEFAKQEYQVEKLEPWDIGYYSEKLRQKKYAISQEDLRPYFPEDAVLDGMFSAIKRLYGMQVKEIKNVDTWHKDVRFFEIHDEDAHLRGQFYIDLYARKNKRGGAWMDECRIRRRLPSGDIQTPVTYLTCNFNAPVGSDSALFTHDEVLTLFHEFGHGLQHMLTTVDYSDVSGINGVPWDAVELASQFNENWCWEKEALNVMSRHYKTHKPIPDELFKKMIAAKNFQAAMQMVRQLEFSLFDFRLHMEFDPKDKQQIQRILDEVRAQVAVVPIAPFNRFQNGFTHIFAGGYGAGYYSYKWAEVLASDAFSKFEETGIFNRQTGNEFLHIILETGGAEDPAVLFKKFRGREPSIDALLRHNGISN